MPADPSGDANLLDLYKLLRKNLTVALWDRQQLRSCVDDLLRLVFTPEQFALARKESTAWQSAHLRQAFASGQPPASAPHRPADPAGRPAAPDESPHPGPPDFKAMTPRAGAQA